MKSSVSPVSSRVPTPLYGLQQRTKEKTILGQQDSKAVLWNQTTMAEKDEPPAEKGLLLGLLCFDSWFLRVVGFL